MTARRHLAGALVLRDRRAGRRRARVGCRPGHHAHRPRHAARPARRCACWSRRPATCDAMDVQAMLNSHLADVQKISRTGPHQRLDLVFAVDTSGSMAGQPIAAAKAAGQHLLDADRQRRPGRPGLVLKRRHRAVSADLRRRPRAHRPQRPGHLQRHRAPRRRRQRAGARGQRHHGQAGGRRPLRRRRHHLRTSAARPARQPCRQAASRSTRSVSPTRRHSPRCRCSRSRKRPVATSCRRRPSTGSSPCWPGCRRTACRRPTRSTSTCRPSPGTRSR